MPERKNQHFVPRALLKPWTLDGKSKAIHLYNIRADRGVPNAPVKNQCSRDYFYGADLKLETWLGQGEELYARTVRPLPSNDAELTGVALKILRHFTHLQLIRTERSIAEEADALRELYDHVFHGELPEGEELPGHEQIVAEAIERWREMAPILDDLKALLVINDSAVPFVITDDPAVHTNKLHTHWLGSANFGTQQSGMILTMPISPRLAVLYYDGHVYTCPDKKACHLHITSDSDAQAFNELQFLKANENIYFRDWDQLASIREGVAAIADRRLAVHFKFHLLVPVEGKEGMFEEAEDISLKPEHSIIHQESVSFRPRAWPSKLRYRHDMSGFGNGSAGGYVRPLWATTSGSNPMRKLKFGSLRGSEAD
jgi:hypothetical protein